MSERELLQDVVRVRGKEMLHRPDAELSFRDGTLIAIEAELSLKRAADLCENLIELVRGEGYLRLKVEHGAHQARKMSQGEQSRYSDIWYFGKEKVRRQVIRERARLVEQGALSKEEAKRIYVKRYPLAKTEEEEDQEEQENQQGLDLKTTRRNQL